MMKACRHTVAVLLLLACFVCLGASASLAAGEGGASGLTIRSSDIMTMVDDMAAGGPAAAVTPVAMVGVRGGTFSGKVVVSSSAAIKGLKATASSLARDGAAGPAIAASAVQVRYAVAWGSDMPRGRRTPKGFDILLESPPEEKALDDRKTAVLPVWITVTIPRDASGGTYKGQVTIVAQGEKPVQVPLVLKVADWTLPDTQQWRTWVELMQSPDTLAVEYGIPLWSDRHWQMIAKSFNFIGQTGSRVVYVPLIAQTNLGNAESMVRWVRKGEGKYGYDFSIMDRYLDTATKHMGQPKLVVLNVWDIYMKPWDEIWNDEWWNGLTEEQRKNQYHQWLKARGDLRRNLQGEHGTGPAVTVLGPTTEEPQTVYLTPYANAASKGLWQPLFTELHRRMKQRGLDDRLMLGMLCDHVPTKEEVALLKDVSGGLRWVSHAHAGRVQRKRASLYGLAEVGYDANAWDLLYAPDPSKERPYGWKRPELVTDFDRFNFNSFLPSTLRHVAEFSITGHQRGVGRTGADFWWAVKDQRGRRADAVWARYPQSQWRHLDILSFILDPGPDGPVASARFEIFREGLQECEARIFIETALIDEALKGKLGADLAKQCQDALDERLRLAWQGAGGAPGDAEGKSWRYKTYPEAHRAFLKSGWLERSEKLYALAGQVAAKLGSK